MKLVDKIGITLLGLFGLSIIYVNYYWVKEHPKTITQTKTAIKYKPAITTTGTLIDIQKEQVSNYVLNHYKGTSKRIKRQILKQIYISAKQYNINPIVLVGISHVESSFRPYIKHAMVSVTVPLDLHWKKSKKIKTQAIGLNGVVYEIWIFHLLENNILETKSDLFDPVISVKATAFILDYYRKQPIVKGASSHMESAVQRYYGVTKNNYYLNKFNNFTGNLIKQVLYKD